MRPLPSDDSELTAATHPWLFDVGAPDDSARARRLDWATLMKRAYALDVLICPKCNGSMAIIGIIGDEEIAIRLLDHLGLSSRAPPRGRPRRPGQQPLFDEAAPSYDSIDPPSSFD